MPVAFSEATLPSAVATRLESTLRSLLNEFGAKACKDRLNSLIAEARESASDSSSDEIDRHSRGSRQSELPYRESSGLESLSEEGSLESNHEKKKSRGMDQRGYKSIRRLDSLVLRQERHIEMEEKIKSAMLDGAFDAIISANEFGIIQTVNKAAVRQFAYDDADEMIGLNVSELAGGGHGKHHNEYLDRFRATRETKMIGTLREVMARRKDHTEFPCILGIEVVENEVSDELLYVTSIRDITQEKRARELAEQNAKQQRIRSAMLDGAFDSMVCANETGVILTVNKAAIKQFGYNSPEEMIGQNVSVLVGGGHAANHDQYLKNFRTTGETKMIGTQREVQARRKDQSEFPCLLGIEVIEFSDEVLYVTSIRDISDEKRAKELVELNLAMLDGAFDSMISANEMGVIQTVNKAAVRQFGYSSAEEMIGLNVSQLAGGGHGENHDEYLKNFRETRKAKMIGTRRELLARRKDGNEFACVLGVEIIERSGKMVYVTSIRDVTDEKRARELVDLNAAMLDGAFDAMVLANEDGFIQTVNKAAVKQFAYDNADEMIGLNVSALAGGGHGKHHDLYLKSYKTTKKAKMIGTMRELSGRRKDKTEFPCVLAVEVVERGEHMFYVTSIRDISDEKKARDLATLNTAMLDGAFDAMVLANEFGVIQRVNKAAVEKFGYSSPEDMLGLNVSAIAGGGHGKNHDQYLKNFRETKKAKLIGSMRELSGKRRDGSEFPCVLAVEVIERGDHMFYVTSIRDISDEKKARELAELNKAMLDGAFDAMVLADEFGVIQTVNKAAVQQFGYASVGEMIGQNVSSIAGGGHEKNHDQYLKNFRATREAKLVGSTRELAGRRKDGTEFPCVLAVEVIERAEQMFYMTSIRDITQEKKARELAELNTAMLDGAFDAMVLADEFGVIQTVNKSAVVQFGYESADEMVGMNVSAIAGGGHGKYHDQYLKNYRNTKQAKLMGTRRELLGRRKDNSEFPCVLGVEVIMRGDNMFYVTSIRDITDEKKAEELKELNTAMLDGAFDAMVLADENGVIQTVNKAAVKQFAYSNSHEMVGMNVSALAGGCHGKHHDQYLKNFRDTRRAKMIGTLRELSGRRKDKTEFPCVLGIEVIERGGKMFYVSSIRDISQETRARELAELNTAMLDGAFDAMILADEFGKIQTVNKAAVSQFGYDSVEEMAGLNVSEIAGGGHGKYHDQYLKNFRETKQAKLMGTRRELAGRRKDKSEFPCVLGVEVILRGDKMFYVTSIRDISDEKQAKDLTELNAAMLDGALDAMILADEEGFIQTVNKAAVTQFRYDSADEMIGLNVSAVAGGGHGKYHDQYLKNFRESKQAKLIGTLRELSGMRKDKTEFPCVLGIGVIHRADEMFYVCSIRDISQEQRARELAKLNTAMLDGAFDAMVLADEFGVIQTVNKAAVKQFGYTDSEEMVGLNVSAIAGGGHGKYHDQYLKNYRTTREAKLMGTMRELSGRRKDNSEFPCVLGVEVIVRGDKMFYVTSIRDISDEKKAREMTELNKAMLDGAFDAMVLADEFGAIQTVNKAAIRQFGYDSAEEMLGLNISALAGGGHGRHHDQYLKSFRETKEAKMIGTLRELSGCRKDQSEFPCVLGVEVIERGGKMFYVSSIRDISDEKRVRELAVLNTAMLDGAFDAMILADEFGVIQNVNKAAAKQFGYGSVDDMVGLNVSKIAGGGHGKHHDQYLRNYRNTKEARLMGTRRELSGKRMDGSEFPCVLGVEVIERGNKMFYVTSIRDISDEKAAREMTELNKAMLDGAFDAMILADEHGVIQTVNKAAVAQFGYSNVEEMIGINVSSIAGGGHGKNHDLYLKNYKTTKVARLMGTRRELSGRRKDATEFPCVLGVEVIERGDKMFFVTSIRDITEEKRARELQEQNAKQEKMRSAMLDGAFDSMICADEFGIMQSVNKAALKQFGYDSPEEMIGRNVSMLVGGGHAIYHDQYLRNFRMTRLHKLIGTQRELYACRKNQTEFPCQLGIEVIEDSSSGRLLYVTTIRDITKQKLARELAEKNAAEEKTKAAILDTAFDALFATDTNGIITLVNQSSLKMFGYDSQDELIGQNIKIVVGGGHAKHHDGYREKFLKTRQKHIMGELREVSARRKDGTEFPAVLGIEFVEPEVGDPLFVGFVRDISEQKRAMDLEVEKRAAEDLLLNMLPEDIALRLKNDPSHLADSFNHVTILFADIVGFTAMSAKMNPIQLVSLLNDLFTRFDTLVDKYGLNKVKTIGDCYMVTSIPYKSDTVAQCMSVCHFAFDMMLELNAYNNEHTDKPLNLRVGINAGPVVAGVVGTKRFLYDLWGDAVNLASRMESTGVPGRIQVTKEVVETVGEGMFEFEPRGEIEVKGKGAMETYFLNYQVDEVQTKYVRTRSQTYFAF